MGRLLVLGDGGGQRLAGLPGSQRQAITVLGQQQDQRLGSGRGEVAAAARQNIASAGCTTPHKTAVTYVELQQQLGYTRTPMNKQGIGWIRKQCCLQIIQCRAGFRM
jgi:hypothetical protein